MRKSRQGSTLIELIIALSLFATAYLALMGLLVSGRTATVQGRDTTIATGLGREMMESNRIVTYGNLTSIPEAQVNVPVVLQGNNSTLTFFRRLDVAPTLSGQAQSLTVTVRWMVGPVNHQIALVTYVAP